MSIGAGRIYAYSAPGYDQAWTRTVGSVTTSGTGRLKVGYTGRSDSRVRVKEQTGTVYPEAEGVIIHLDEPARPRRRHLLHGPRRSQGPERGRSPGRWRGLRSHSR